ncbi:hypothetical protein Nepgr_017824 [Nepenthes gracilis]|uniref:F-box domain-containing protein n=1 Tax=Nepenthes gracilis TaxID=150966 RepID=A0AAD3SR71_NEPGR|nr:hypothetical protein Nepgr_017824 [Nepenthes gracilis]
MMSSQYLPEDILSNILSRLPVQSLLRFRSVCKFWYALIGSPSFKEEHYHHAASKNDGQLLVEHEIRNRVKCSLLDNILHVSKYLDFPMEFTNSSTILGVCNGIVLISLNGVDKIVLWNPAIREVRVLPNNLRREEKVQRSRIGFGYDPKTNDYKVVRIFLYWDKKRRADCIDQSVEVYSLSTNMWREIKPSGIYGYGMFCEEAYACGAYHWLVYNHEDDGLFVLSFDMTNEVFYRTGFSLDASNKGRLWKLLTVNESIAIVLYKLVGFGECFDVWIRNHLSGDINEGYWTKKCSLKALCELGRSVEKPLLFWKNGLFLVESGAGNLTYCDTFNGKLRQIDVHFDDPLRVSNVFIYKESLFSLKTPEKSFEHS